MRTTLDLDEDVLLAANELARRRRISLGKAVSELARCALMQQDAAPTRNDIPLFPIRTDAQVVTQRLVDQFRDEAP